MIQIRDFIDDFPLEGYAKKKPWDLIHLLPKIITEVMATLGDDFAIKEGVAIHKTAVVEPGVILKPPIIVSAKSFVGAHAYLRGGVYIGESVVIGPGCEIKSSVVGGHSSMAHFNFIGDSIIGSYVNFEAGAITANYHNDKPDKQIYSVYNSNIMDTGVEKFGSMVGDHSKVGANAVLSPGTLLPKNTIIGRLQLVNQHVNAD